MGNHCGPLFRIINPGMGVRPQTLGISPDPPFHTPWQRKCLSPANEAYFHAIWLSNEDQAEDKFANSSARQASVYKGK